MTECYFNSRLPAELRVRIFEYVLSFEAPLKLRTVVAGHKNTGILRASRSIYHEALPVLYDCNTILLTRNDFCYDTGGELSTPMRRDRIRHLLINNFSTSVKCSSLSGGNNMFLEGCCEVCQPSGAGFISTLVGLPQIRSVVIDYSRHPSNFQYIKQVVRGKKTLNGMEDCRLVCTGMARYQLISPAFPPGLTIEYTNRPVNTIWNEFLARGHKLTAFGYRGEAALLRRLRDNVHREIPDKLYLLHCAHKSFLWPQTFARMAKLWDDVTDAVATGRDISESMDALTEEVCGFMLQLTPLDARMALDVLRTRQTVHEERAAARSE